MDGIRSYEVRETTVRGKTRFQTILRWHGYWTDTLMAKNRRSAIRKGDDYVAGRRLREQWRERRAAKEASPGKARIIGIGLGLHH